MIGKAGHLRYAEAEKLLAAEGGSLPIPMSASPLRRRADSRPLLYGYASDREMFNARQLYCLGLIGAEVAKTADLAARRALALAFSHSLASNNMFCGYAFGYRRLTPLFSVHAFRKVSRPVEGHVWGLRLGRGSFSNAVRALVEGKEYMRRPYEYRYGGSPTGCAVSVALPPRPAPPPVRILNQSAADLAEVESGSVDLILTDPPYFDNLSYSELSRLLPCMAPGGPRGGVSWARPRAHADGLVALRRSGGPRSRPGLQLTPWQSTPGR